MDGPKFPDITVELPTGADTGVLRTRTQKALLAAGKPDDAKLYVEETKSVAADPGAVVALTRAWVAIEGDVDVAAHRHQKWLNDGQRYPNRSTEHSGGNTP